MSVLNEIYDKLSSGDLSVSQIDRLVAAANLYALTFANNAEATNMLSRITSLAISQTEVAKERGKQEKLGKNDEKPQKDLNPEQNNEALRKVERVDDQGYRHEVEYDEQGKVIADRKYDGDKLIGEGIYKDGEFVGSKEYRTDDEGYRHEIEYDVQGKTVANKRFNGDRLVGEGIYENGEFVGNKEYRLSYDGYRHEIEFDKQGLIVADKKFDGTELIGEGLYKEGIFVGSKGYHRDDEGYRHEIKFDKQGVIVADRKFDGAKLVSERLYEEGVFVGRKEYRKDDDGYRHEVEYDAQGKAVADKKFDGAELVGEGIYKDGEFVGSKEYQKTSVVMIDEEKLPQLRLAGKEGMTFDLNEISDELKALKPGEKLALGRAPEDVGVEGKNVKVGENNNYVSRHHCDIQRNAEGKLELVDCSANGTEVLQPDVSRQATREGVAPRTTLQQDATPRTAPKQNTSSPQMSTMLRQRSGR